MQHRQASRLLARAAALAALLAARTLAMAQLCTEGPPTQLGVVVPLAMQCPQGAGPLPDTTCSVVQVKCQGLASLAAQLRVTEPPAGLPVRGTVVFGTGGGGTGFYAAGSDGQALFETLRAQGFRLVDRAWQSPWTSGEAGLRGQSCRYATLLTFIHDELHTQGEFCASGNSGGSAEIGYALTTWGRGEILDVAVPTSGPPLGRLDLACPDPPDAAWLAECAYLVPEGALDCEPACSFGPAGNPVCDECSPTPSLEELRADSVVHEDALLDYPGTELHFLYGSEDCGVSVPMGLSWALSVTSPRTLSFVPGTPHALFSTAAGRAAIAAALLAGTAPAPVSPTLLVTARDGDRVEIAYEPACQATDHAVHAGPLAEISRYGYDASVCGLGTSGLAEVDLGPGDRFFVVAGRSGWVQGSLGVDSDGSERPAPPPGGSCFLPQTLGGACP